MKAFLWHNINKVSDNYHANGSVLIEAETVERARELAVFRAGYGDQKTTEQMDVDRDPDAVFDSPSTTEHVWVFPDAGCC